VLALLRSGDLERHVRRMRLEYARRRAALVEGLTAAGLDGAGPPPRFRLLGETAGLHVVLELPADYPATRLIDAAAARGVTVFSLDRYFAGPPAMSGLILGYGTATVAQLRQATAILAPLLACLP
jgi:GntR family transcriptional regulator/MocR family aminotransferase